MFNDGLLIIIFFLLIPPEIAKKESSIQARVSCLFSYFGMKLLDVRFNIFLYIYNVRACRSSSYFQAYKNM